jgi:hypothetical protein
MSTLKQIVLLVLSLMLMACTATNAPAPTIAPLPTTPPPDPSAMLSPTVAATVEVVPTVETAVSPDVSLTTTPPSLAVTATPTIFSDLNLIVSPSGEWAVAIAPLAPYVREELEYFQARLAVQSLTDGTEHVVVEEERGYGLGYEPITFIQWSADGTAFYYSDTPSPDGCAPFLLWHNLYRVTLADGESTAIGPDLFSAMALSPNEQHLVYLNGQSLVIRDLPAGNEINYQLPPYEESGQVGNFLWSPDSQSVLFLVAEQPCDPDQRRTTIYRYDLPTATLGVVLRDSPELFVLRSWDTADSVTLYQSRTDEVLTLNVLTGQFSPVP